MKEMSAQLKPKPSEAMKRCTFHTAKQDAHESVADFAARLKKLALHCNFTELDTAIRDQLVCGVSDKDTRVKLFEEKDLTLKKALDIAIAREAAVKNAANSNNTFEKKSVKNEVYAMQSGQQRAWQRRGRGKPGKAFNERFDSKPQQIPRQQQQQQRQPATGSSSVSCYCCGKANHKSNECYYR